MMSKEQTRNFLGLVVLILVIPVLIILFNTNKKEIEPQGEVEGIITSNYTHITPAEFNKAITAIADRNIIDVRTPEEFADGHIEGAVNIDFYSADFQDQIKLLDKNKYYFIYCRTGNRSSQTVKMMEEFGFENVKGLAGGINSWAAVFEVEE